MSAEPPICPHGHRSYCGSCEEAIDDAVRAKEQRIATLDRHRRQWRRLAFEMRDALESVRLGIQQGITYAELVARIDEAMDLDRPDDSEVVP
jgi:hypothetical protein